MKHKYLLAVTIQLFVSAYISAQYRVNDIATDSIETIYQKYKSHFDSKNYSTADSLSHLLYDYWKKRIKSETSEQLREKVFQNYYNAYLNSAETKFYLRKLGKNFGQELRDLESDMKKNLDDSNIIYGKYYYSMASVLQYLVGDIEGAERYLLKELAIKELHFGEGSMEVANALAFLAEAYRKKNDLDLALEHHNKAAGIYRSLGEEDTKEYLAILSSIAIVYYKQGNYDLAIKEQEAVLELTEELGIEEPKWLALINLAEYYRHIDDFSKARNLAYQALALSRELHSEKPTLLSQQYITLTTINGELGRNDEASAFVDSSLHILDTHGIDENRAMLYGNKAEVQDNLNQTIEYYNKAIEACPDDRRCYKDVEANIYLNLGNAYTRKGKLEFAFNCFQKAEQMLESLPEPALKPLAKLYKSMAALQEGKGDLNQTIFYLSKSSQIIEIINSGSIESSLLKSELALLALENKEPEEAQRLIEVAMKLDTTKGRESNSKLGKFYKNIAEFYLELGEGVKAQNYAEKCLSIYKKNYGEESYRLNSIRLLMARIQQATGSIEAATRSLDKLSSICGYDFSDPSNTDCIPEFQLWNSFYFMLDYMEIDRSLKLISNVETVSRIRYGLRLIDKLRNQFFFEVSEMEFQEKIRNYIDWALKELHMIYNNEKDKEVLALMFECIEKSRSISISRSFNRIRSVAGDEIPEKWLNREKLILSRYQQAYERYNSGEINDSLEIVYTDEMLSMQSSKSDFLDSLEKAYPKYYQDRYAQSVVSLKDVESLADWKDYGFLLYYAGDSILYQLIVGSAGTELNVLQGKMVNVQVRRLKNLVSDVHKVGDERLFESNKTLFIEENRKLTELLFDKNVIQSLPHKLCVIPDGPFIGFPFEILLIDETKVQEPYSQLPYLINDHIVHYSGSLTHFHRQAAGDNTISLTSYVGFAPAYSVSDEDARISLTRDVVNERPLLYNGYEVENTSTLFEGSSFVGVDATEQKFIDYSSGKDILHLAMHAYVDEDIPLDSYLSFTKSNESDYDGKLYLHEIARMNLKHDLVVLSACETNRSSEGLGEGLLGIARGFNNAQCPNLIMTNWVVDDKSSSEIICSFFKNFKKEKQAALALREAKLDYIKSNSALYSHPAYWAAFSFYGYPEGTSTSDPNLLFLAGGLVLAGLLWFMFSGSRKN